MNTFNLNLDLDKRGGVAQWVTLRQGDRRGTELRATIYDHGTQAGGGYTCRVSIRLPGAGDEYYRETATYTNGVAVVTVDEEYAAAIVGVTEGYFELLQGDAVIASTESFGVRILRSAQDGAVPGDKYDSAIDDALAELDEATGRISQMVVDATEEYLEAHPELTTTVEDNSLTDIKLIQHGGILDRVARLMYRLDNLLTATPAESDALTVTDAAKTPLAGLALYGRSTQDGTPTPDAPVPIKSVTPNLYTQTGYAAGATYSTAGITVTHNADGTVTVNGTATASAWLWGGGNNADDRLYVSLPAGTYSVCGSNNVAVQKKVGDTVTTIVGSTASFATFTLAEETLIKAVPVLTSGTTVDNAIAWVAVYAGDIWHPYVPYGYAGLFARGRNLIRQSFYPDGYQRTSNGLTITYNADGTCMVDGTATANAWMWGSSSAMNKAVYTLLTAGTYTASVSQASGVRMIGRKLTDGSSASSVLFDYRTDPYTFTLNEPTWVLIAPTVTNGATVSNLTVWVMLNTGTSALPFVAAEDVVTPIPLQGHALRSLPDGTRDEVTVDQYGHATLVQRVGSVTYDGTESWTTATVSGTQVYRLSNQSSATGWDTSGSGQVQRLCNKLEVVTSDAALAATAGTYRSLTHLSVNWDGTNNDLTTFKAALAATPLEIVYKLATPVTIDLGTIDPVALQGPDMTAQSVPTAPFRLTYERDLNATLARLEAAIADAATS